MRVARSKRRLGEQGSALLFVFVMAALVAIFLYREIPGTLFEAQREREQQLIDRGEEYSHAIKLFTRKTGRYPPSLDALDGTNQTRFLRHRFVDPLTKKDNWRLLHAGPGGRIMDSKVRPALTVAGTGPLNGESAKNHNASSASFANFASSISSAVDAVIEQPMLPPLVKRPPAVSANGSEQSGDSDLPSTPDQIRSVAASQLESRAFADDASSNAVTRGKELSDQSGRPPQSGESPAESIARQGAVTPGSSATNAAGQQLTSDEELSIGGGIAGVASRAVGRAIKSVNGQTDFSLWEFYYDPLTDPMRFGRIDGIAVQSGPSSGTKPKLAPNR